MPFLILLLSTIALIPIPSIGQPVAASFGSIQSYSAFPSRFISPRQIDIWIPPNYSKNNKYAVLYMHDGQMLFDASNTWNHQEWGVDETMAKLSVHENLMDCIIVGIWNNGPARHSEYFPQKPFEQLPKPFRDSLINNATRTTHSHLFSQGIQSDNYLCFLTSELKPFIDSAYSTLADASHTFIAGSSMGGLISMYALCEYPNIFGGAACLSTHWPGIFSVDNNPIPNAFLNYFKETIPSPENHLFYFDFGTATLDSLYEPFQAHADTILSQKGYNSTNWSTIKWEGADHSERAWNERLRTPLLLLLKNKVDIPKR
jgi:hypothetical protein